MKIGDEVNTICGTGVYVGDDNYPDIPKWIFQGDISRRQVRHKVKLHVDPYNYDSGVVCFYPDEILV